MKTTMRCGYAPLRMANINIATAPNAGEDAEMQTPRRCVWLHRSGKEFDPPTQEPHAWTSYVPQRRKLPSTQESRHECPEQVKSEPSKARIGPVALQQVAASTHRGTLPSWALTQ